VPDDIVMPSLPLSAPQDLKSYFQSVAEARYAIRKSFRIIDEEARAHGLEPLQHQALIQVFGARDSQMTISQLAERLDVTPALASRLVRGLVADGHLTRVASRKDRRLTYVEITEPGIRVLVDILTQVELKIEMFQRRLRPDEKLSALMILGIYVGVPLGRKQLRDLSDVS
jgi:DNA-binding MarR family transcriptional regulator